MPPEWQGGTLAGIFSAYLRRVPGRVPYYFSLNFLTLNLIIIIIIIHKIIYREMRAFNMFNKLLVFVSFCANMQ